MVKFLVLYEESYTESSPGYDSSSGFSDFISFRERTVVAEETENYTKAMMRFDILSNASYPKNLRLIEGKILKTKQL